MRHLSLVVIKTNVALSGNAMAPEALNGRSILGMGEQEPEAKDWLGKDVKNSISNDLSINRPLSGSIRDTPDNRVQGPENKCEASNSSEELGGSIALGSHSTTSTNSKDVNDEEVGNACHGVPAPCDALLGSEGSEETSENHDDVRDDGDEDVSSGETGEEGEVEEEERSGERPIDVAGPEDLAEDVLKGVVDVLVGFPDDNMCVAGTFTGCHGEVGEGSEGGDQGGDDVEETLLLLIDTCWSSDT